MTDSIQKRLSITRPPRVQITYDVDTNGAMERLELPFIVGILADLKGDRKEGDDPVPMSQRRMADIDRDTFDSVLKSIAPRVQINTQLPHLEKLRDSDDDDDKSIVFTELDDFKPLQLVQAIPVLRESYRARSQIRWLQSKAEASGHVADTLERWLKFDPKKDDANTAQVRAALGTVFITGDAPNAAAIASMRAGLVTLYDLLQANQARKAEIEGAADQAAAKTAADTARTAAVAELAKWGLSADASAKPAITDDDVLGWGDAMVNALALSASGDNDKIAARLIKLLGEATDPATLVDQEKQRNASRIHAQTLLGYADLASAKAAADQIAADLGSDTAAVSEAAHAKARFLAGVADPVAGSEVKPPLHMDIDTVKMKYLGDCFVADARGMYLRVMNYLAKSGAAEAPLVGRELFRLITLLKPNRIVTVPAILYRLFYFVQQIYMPWQQEDKALLAKQKQGVCAVIDQRVIQIDQDLSNALSAIMHMPSFRKLEASWRGLKFLVANTLTNTKLKLKLFNATKEELRKDMETAVEFDQSALFKLIYEAEYGTYGGDPYSLLVGDYDIGATSEDIDFIKKIAEVAASAHAPFLAAAAPELFGLDDFRTLAQPRDLSKIFEGKELELWNEFRAMDDARYVTLVMPRALLRLPYGKDNKRNTTPCEGLNFDERVADGEAVYSPDDPTLPLSYPTPDAGSFLWGNPAYVLAERITNAFSLYGWTAAIRGVEGGGLVENLPLYSYLSDAGTTELFPPTEVTITDRREKELSDLGFMSLCHCKGTATAAFFGGQTTISPKTYFQDDANANARLSAMLPYILAASRFAHYIKVIMRKKVGSFLTRGNVEAYLNNWIAQYVLLDDNAPQEAKAAFPLRAAKVMVTESAGLPGHYSAVVFLKPHYQLEELTTSIRLVANIAG